MKKTQNIREIAGGLNGASGHKLCNRLEKSGWKELEPGPLQFFFRKARRLIVVDYSTSKVYFRRY